MRGPAPTHDLTDEAAPTRWTQFGLTKYKLFTKINRGRSLVRRTRHGRSAKASHPPARPSRRNMLSPTLVERGQGTGRREVRRYQAERIGKARSNQGSATYPSGLPCTWWGRTRRRDRKGPHTASRLGPVTGVKGRGPCTQITSTHAIIRRHRSDPTPRRKARSTHLWRESGLRSGVP